jgi:hypothetical protein
MEGAMHRGRRRPVRYTIIHLQTFEMKVVEKVSRAEVEGCRSGTTAIVDMATGRELALEDAESAMACTVDDFALGFGPVREAA